MNFPMKSGKKGMRMKIEELDAAIKVGAIFKGSEILPRWFEWENRKYTVREINYTWMDRNGREKIHCFSVTDGSNNYEISFNTELTNWKLNKICQP